MRILRLFGLTSLGRKFSTVLSPIQKEKKSFPILRTIGKIYLWNVGLHSLGGLAFGLYITNKIKKNMGEMYLSPKEREEMLDTCDTIAFSFLELGFLSGLVFPLGEAMLISILMKGDIKRINAEDLLRETKTEQDTFKEMFRILGVSSLPQDDNNLGGEKV